MKYPCTVSQMGAMWVTITTNRYFCVLYGYGHLKSTFKSSRAWVDLSQ